MGLIIGQGTKSGGGGGDVRLETNHNATIETNGTHVVTPTDGYDGMRKATIKVEVVSQYEKSATLGGTMYNMHDAMKSLKADNRTSNFSVIMLCEYYVGYNSLELSGADAYITNDGAFYQEASVTHYWSDANNGKFDRWVAFLYRNTNTNYTVPSTLVCPRKILVDGTMGAIFLNAEGRIERLECTEGSSVADLKGGYSYYSVYNNPWEVNAYIGKIRNHNNVNNPLVYLSTSRSVCLDIELETAGMLILCTKELVNIYLPSLTTISGATGCIVGNNSTSTGVQNIVAPLLRQASKLFYGKHCVNVRYIHTPSLISCPTIWATTTAANSSAYADLIHWEIGQGFNSQFDLRLCTFANCLLTDSNDLVEDVTAHPTWSNLDQWLYNFEHLIVDKLADLTGQTAKTITLAATPYAAITESIRSKMSAKNWNLASA